MIMDKKNHSLTFSLVAVLILISAVLTPLSLLVAQSAGNINDVIGDLETTATKAKIISEGARPPTLYQFIGRLVNFALIIIGLVFLVLIIYAGYIWLMARGNDQEISRAVDYLRNGFIGLIVILGAYLLTNYVIFKILGITIK